MTYNPLDANIPDPVSEGRGVTGWAGGITVLAIILISGIAWFVVAWQVLLNFELLQILAFLAVSVPFFMGMDRLLNIK